MARLSLKHLSLLVGVIAHYPLSLRKTKGVWEGVIYDLSVENWLLSALGIHRGWHSVSVDNEKSH